MCRDSKRDIICLCVFLLNVLSFRFGFNGSFGAIYCPFSAFHSRQRGVAGRHDFFLET